MELESSTELLLQTSVSTITDECSDEDFIIPRNMPLFKKRNCSFSIFSRQNRKALKRKRSFVSVKSLHSEDNMKVYTSSESSESEKLFSQSWETVKESPNFTASHRHRSQPSPATFRFRCILVFIAFVFTTVYAAAAITILI